jgi:hypothetical protein
MDNATRIEFEILRARWALDAALQDEERAAWELETAKNATHKARHRLSRLSALTPAEISTNSIEVILRVVER